MRSKRVLAAAVMLAGMTSLLVSLSYAGFGLDVKMTAPKVDVPSVVLPNVSMPNMSGTIGMPVSNLETLKSYIPVGKKTGQETKNPCSGSALCANDTVTKIVDGDTIYTTSYKIRLALTNTPEKYQKGFSEASSFTSGMCPVGSVILVDQDDKQKTDIYGRIVAKVTCSGKNLNSELLESNHAIISTQSCAKSEFSSESWAKKFGC